MPVLVATGRTRVGSSDANTSLSAGGTQADVAVRDEMAVKIETILRETLETGDGIARVNVTGRR